MSTPIEEVLEPLRAIEWEHLPATPQEVPPALVRNFDAVITGHTRWTRASFDGPERLVLVARWGAGVDKVDLRAATDADVLVATSPRPGIASPSRSRSSPSSSRSRSTSWPRTA
jgi:phosphoglycerate dehydrogenase-like enzyme